MSIAGRIAALKKEIAAVEQRVKNDEEIRKQAEEDIAGVEQLENELEAMLHLFIKKEKPQEDCAEDEDCKKATPRPRGTVSKCLRMTTNKARPAARPAGLRFAARRAAVGLGAGSGYPYPSPPLPPPPPPPPSSAASSAASSAGTGADTAAKPTSAASSAGTGADTAAKPTSAASSAGTGAATAAKRPRGTKSRGGAREQAKRQLLAAQPPTAASIANIMSGDATEADFKLVRFAIGGAALQEMINVRDAKIIKR
jgi:hypothetical protein